MKLMVVVLSCLAAVTSAWEPIQRHYHDAVGVPLAAAIKQAELAADFDGSRIVSGSQAALGAYPYMGGLLITLSDGRTSVGESTLVTNTRLVTAAHNWFDGRNSARELTVVLGSVQLYSGGTRINSNRVEIHGNYDSNNVNNDIAIITINWVNYSNTIRNIGLASGSNNFAGTWAWAAGFGQTWAGSPASSSLMHARMQVITNAVCLNTYGPSVIVDSTLCTSGVGANICTGDSGGPLVADNVLIGVTSFGSWRGCDAGQPSGFARVSSFNSWIRARL